ncbi:MAG: PEP-CTERM sorting domain-containing protein [Phycisphaerae bacterium]|nr:PEP-CTERM sorting domain-containing protein [Phycisphaerae bacterium]
MRRKILQLTMVFVLCLGTGALAGTITLTAGVLRVLQEGDPDAVNGPDVNEWNDATVRSGNELQPVLSFDLSGVTQEITGAYIRLYELNNSKNTSGVVQVGSLVSPHDISGITWNKVHGGSPEFTLAALESLGSYTGDNSTPNDTWYDTDAASSADVAALEALRTGASKKLVIDLAAPSGQRWWGGVGEVAPQLVLTTIPEPATMSLLVAGGAFALIRRKR